MDNKKGNLKWNIAQAVLSSPGFWSGVATVGVVFWTWLTGWFTSQLAPLMIPTILTTVAFTYYIVDRINKTRKSDFSKQSNDQIQSTLRKWLDRRRWSIKQNPSESSLFNFSVTDEQKRPINIKRPKNNPSVIQLVVIVSEERGGIAQVPKEEQSNLRFRIGIEMARMGVIYSEMPLFVYLELPCDASLTESVFLSAIDRIRQACVLIIAHIKETLVMLNVVVDEKAVAPSVNQQVPDKEGSQP